MKKSKLKCPMCERTIINPIYIRIFERRNGKKVLDRDIAYCSKLCGEKAIIIWENLVIGVEKC